MKIDDLVEEYLRFLKTAGRTPRTLAGRKYDLGNFTRFLKSINVVTLENLTGSVMAEYQEELAFSLSKKGRPLALRSQAQLLGVAKGFTRYLKEQDYVMHDPGEKIKVPRKPKRLPKVILKVQDMSGLMNSPDMQTNQGYRDRIILELLYDTAIRRAELRDMLISDMDLDAGYIRVNGKGNKDRVVPVNKHVCELVRNYIAVVRPELLKESKDTGHLILNRWGKQMSGKGIWEVVKRHSSKAGLMSGVSTHTMRHTCATHMLKNGAPVRHLQEMLGHESLESTQIYTHVSINDLKEVHAKFHPGEKLDDEE